uniref:Uncharacterized protein n=1 Tax=Candidatus Methanogaster sp. ANME-2c ERB4 TaxID=2759911 RepID=A0A7G9Y8A1_9EURY|nr:hypothetical protein KKMEGMOG_00002 [Methanosarcinales archaeon ANME-2c ERB4]QNO46552.1 hypothetical protein OKODDAAN_00002 [Methanosarcinales archaeon ANME-2c ERB4]
MLMWSPSDWSIALNFPSDSRSASSAALRSVMSREIAPAMNPLSVLIGNTAACMTRRAPSVRFITVSCNWSNRSDCPVSRNLSTPALTCSCTAEVARSLAAIRNWTSHIGLPRTSAHKSPVIRSCPGFHSTMVPCSSTSTMPSSDCSTILRSFSPLSRSASSACLRSVMSVAAAYITSFSSAAVALHSNHL